MRITKLASTVLAAFGLLISGFACPAQAADATRTKHYSQTRYEWIEGFKLCAQVKLTGYLRADVYFTPIEGGAYATITNPRIIDPAVSMVLRTSCSPTAPLKTYHRANKVTYQNHFYGYKCSFNPSFSVSVPWGVTVGATPDCGNENVARYTQTIPKARSTYKFGYSTDGRAVRWSQRRTDTQPTTLSLCTSASAFVKFEDTVGPVTATRDEKLGFGDICVTYSYFN